MTVRTPKNPEPLIPERPPVAPAPLTVNHNPTVSELPPNGIKVTLTETNPQRNPERVTVKLIEISGQRKTVKRKTRGGNGG